MSLKIDFTNEDVPVNAELKNGEIELTLDDNKYPFTLKIDYDKAVEIADMINHACMNRTQEEWEEREFELRARIEELEEEVEVKEETIDLIKHKENNYITF